MAVDKKQIKILIVDDDVRFVDKTFNTLSSLGYDASVCFAAKEAQHLIIQRPYHIILLDCLMPDMDGHSLAQYVQKHFGSSIVVILMSAVFQKNDVLFPNLLNVSSIMKKPFSENQLQMELDKAEEKLFSPGKDNHISSSIFGAENDEEAINSLKKLKLLREGDVLLLFSYLLHSGFEGTLQLNDHSRSVSISFSNKCIVDVHEKDNVHLIEYFSSKNILRKEELAPFMNLKQDEIFENLMDNSLISPHYFMMYKIDQLMSFLKDFSKKTSFRFSLLPLRNSSIKIHHSQILNTFTDFIENGLSETYLKWFINKVESNSMMVNEDRKRIWMNQKLSILDPIQQRVSDLESCGVLYKFLNLFSSGKNAIYKSIFWLISQDFINIKSEKYNFKKNYLMRYESLLKLFNFLSFEDLFKVLGCKNPYDAKELKKIYHAYMRLNHVNKFFQYGEELKKIIEEVNRIVAGAYDTISNEEKLDAYKRKRHIADAKHMMKIEKIKSKVLDIIRNCKYDKASQLLDDLDNMPKLDEISKNEIILWRTIIEIEQSQYDFTRKQSRRINIQMDKVKQNQVIFSSLYHYTLGMLALCDSDKSLAKSHFNKSLTIDDAFHLAKIKKMSI